MRRTLFASHSSPAVETARQIASSHRCPNAHWAVELHPVPATRASVHAPLEQMSSSRQACAPEQAPPSVRVSSQSADMPGMPPQNHPSPQSCCSVQRPDVVSGSWHVVAHRSPAVQDLTQASPRAGGSPQPEGVQTSAPHSSSRVHACPRMFTHIPGHAPLQDPPVHSTDVWHTAPSATNGIAARLGSMNRGSRPQVREHVEVPVEPSFSDAHEYSLARRGNLADRTPVAESCLLCSIVDGSCAAFGELGRELDRACAELCPRCPGGLGAVAVARVGARTTCAGAARRGRVDALSPVSTRDACARDADAGSARTVVRTVDAAAEGFVADLRRRARPTAGSGVERCVVGRVERGIGERNTAIASTFRSRRTTSVARDGRDERREGDHVGGMRRRPWNRPGELRTAEPPRIVGSAPSGHGNAQYPPPIPAAHAISGAQSFSVWQL